MEGFQKPLSQPGSKSVGLARVSYQGDRAVCSCGWGAGAARVKILEDKIDRHLAKRHNGRGIRL